MKDFASTAFEQAAISVSGKVTAGGSVAAIGSGVAGKTVQVVAENPDVIERAVGLAEIGAVVGMSVAVIGLITNLYFNLDKSRRERALFRARMAALKDKHLLDE